YGEEIAEYCEQLRDFRNKKGVLPEPLWYAGIGVLAFCKDGDEVAHKWSSGDARYTAKETQSRLERTRKLTGATTCQHFHGLKPDACERCEHWGKIKSPILLGTRPSVLRAATQQSAMATSPRWELTRGGVLKPGSYINATIALSQLGIKFRHDIF